MEEISLREIIEIIIKRKKIIAIITALLVVFASIANFLVLDPVYEAKAILMASSLNSKQQNIQQPIEGVEAILNAISQYPQMTIETYKEQISNPHILQQTIDELKLEEKGITRTSLKRMLSLDTIKDTNLITITVRNTDKGLAKDIANTIARKFTDFVSTTAKEQASKSSVYIKQQMDIEKQNLDKVLLEYKTYLSQPRGLNELQKEVDSKLELITQYKSDFLNSGIEEQKVRASLSAAERQFKSTPEKFTVSRSLLDEPYMSQAIEESTGNSGQDLFNITVEAEEVNDSYIDLKNTLNNLNIQLANIIAQKNNIQDQIGELQKELITLQADLGGKQHEDIIIQEKVKFAQDTYNSFLEAYEEARITQSSAIGDASIIVISPAVEPIQPVAPNKLQNIAIAAVLGLILGVLIAFFKEYWQSSTPKDINA